MTGETALAVAAMLVSAASYAASGVYAKRQLAGVSASTLALGQQLAAAVWLAAPALWQLPDARPTRAATLALLALALLSTTVAYVLYFHLIATVGPTRTTTVTYLLPIFGMAWGAVFLDERVTAGMLAGLALILGSVVLVNGVRLGRAAAPSSASRSPGAGARPRGAPLAGGRAIGANGRRPRGAALDAHLGNATRLSCPSRSTAATPKK
jgi:drug/metabolite transporter (DMT)-like permease